MDWLLDRLATGALVVIGCIGAEERGVAVPELVRRRVVERVAMFRVRDSESHYDTRIAEKVASNRARLESAGVIDEVELGLFARDEEIAEGFWELVHAGRREPVNLVVDISCLPKRFFFLLTKLALRERRIGTLIVAYTQAGPGGYVREPLAGDPEEVRAIPGFGPVRGEPEMLVVGLGFEALGLPQLIGEYRDRERDVEVLLPFPPGQPYSRRVWRSLQSVGLGRGSQLIRRVSAVDAFDTLGAIEDVVGRRRVQGAPALAPYGPKPVSLGMCLYAMKRGAAVLYTQPRFYHPDYTKGIGESWGYCLKRGGRRTF